MGHRLQRHIAVEPSSASSYNVPRAYGTDGGRYYGTQIGLHAAGGGAANAIARLGTLRAAYAGRPIMGLIGVRLVAPNRAARRERAGTGATGLEPATSGVTGRRSNQLNYAPLGRSIVA